MANIIPEQLVNFKVYNGFSDMVGVADVTLPGLEAMTNEVKGAGIAGTYNSPVTGHFGPMSMTVNWRVITGDALKLATPKAHQLDLRGVIDTYDAGDGRVGAGPGALDGEPHREPDGEQPDGEDGGGALSDGHGAHSPATSKERGRRPTTSPVTSSLVRMTTRYVCPGQYQL